MDALQLESLPLSFFDDALLAGLRPDVDPLDGDATSTASSGDPARCSKPRSTSATSSRAVRSGMRLAGKVAINDATSPHGVASVTSTIAEGVCMA